MAAAACSFQGSSLVPSMGHSRQNHLLKSHKMSRATVAFGSRRKLPMTRCSIGLEDFIGGDLVKLDLGQWLEDVEEHKALAIYSPHEGGYEGRYLNRLRYKGCHFLDLSARGLGDPETTLTKFHPVCPVLSKAELQFLAILLSLRPKVKVIAECGN